MKRIFWQEGAAYGSHAVCALRQKLHAGTGAGAGGPVPAAEEEEGDDVGAELASISKEHKTKSKTVG